MKKIILMPVRNEKWILPTTINAGLKIADHILIADQNSNDGSKEFYKNESKILVIPNNNKDHSNQIRWELLDQSRKLFGENNLIMNIDADEIVPPNLFEKEENNILSHKPGTIFSSPWVQLWRSVYKYRSDDGIWNPSNNQKPFMFIDNKIMDYEREYIINDHTARVPIKNSLKIIETKIPLLHFQFVNWERSQIKQAWYQCKELLSGVDYKTINNKYKNSVTEINLKLSDIKGDWVKDVNLHPEISDIDLDQLWYLKEINSIFNEHGIRKFKKLNIWDSKHLVQIRKNF